MAFARAPSLARCETLKALTAGARADSSAWASTGAQAPVAGRDEPACLHPQCAVDRAAHNDRWGAWPSAPARETRSLVRPVRLCAPSGTGGSVPKPRRQTGVKPQTLSPFRPSARSALRRRDTDDWPGTRRGLARAGHRCHRHRETPWRLRSTRGWADARTRTGTRANHPPITSFIRYQSMPSARLGVRSSLPPGKAWCLRRANTSKRPACPATASATSWPASPVSATP